ncbi:hypothetical protein D3C87_259730 [compost metagenome]
MASFSDEFKKYQKREKYLTATIVVVAILAPASFTWLVEHKFHWALSAFVGIVVILAAVWIHIYRDQVSKKVLSHYEDLDVGAILAKKISTKRSTQFVITNTGYSHFYLKCLNTGEQVLVSKSRIREDFDIAN